MKIYKYGDNVDTDVIIPARYLNSFDAKELASHAMVDIDPDFAKTVESGDIIVAGKNFGCGSSREHAPLCLKTAGINQGDEVTVDFTTGLITNITKGETYQSQPFPEFLQKMIELDGLVNYVNSKKG